jgi:hypothetical protein
MQILMEQNVSEPLGKKCKCEEYMPDNNPVYESFACRQSRLVNEFSVLPNNLRTLIIQYSFPTHVDRLGHLLDNRSQITLMGSETQAQLWCLSYDPPHTGLYIKTWLGNGHPFFFQEAATNSIDEFVKLLLDKFWLRDCQNRRFWKRSALTRVTWDWQIRLTAIWWRFYDILDNF